MLYTNLIPFLANLPVLLTTGLPAADTLLWIPIIFFGPIGMYIGIVAVKHASASMLGPYTLLRLVIGVLGGVVIFHELPDIFSAGGAALILGGCVLSSGIGIGSARGRAGGRLRARHVPAPGGAAVPVAAPARRPRPAIS